MTINVATAIFLVILVMVFFIAKVICAALTEFLTIAIREFMKARGIGIMREHWSKKDQDETKNERRVLGFQTTTTIDKKEEP